MRVNDGLTRYAWLSIATAIVVILLKLVAYWLTQSIGFLSDALESGANLIAAFITLFALIIASRPPDREHAFGHSKAEYLSSGAEGTLILLAAIFIAVQALSRLNNPQPLAQVRLGVLVSAIAAIGNFAVARTLLNAGKKHRSAALVADAHHLLTDVWTSLGVIVAVALVGLTGWYWLDPVIALIVAAQIIFTGYKLIRGAADGLMDVALPDDEVEQIKAILVRHHSDGVTYHALRTRQAGAQRFASVHLQVPGDWSVQKGHELVEAIELEINDALAPINVTTHIEPMEDPASWRDASLNRSA